MSSIIIPEGYKSVLSLYETQTAIGLLKECFERELSKSLNLRRVSAPLFVEHSTGLNDDLNGYERPVRFSIKETGSEAEVVHSLAKWKRMALKKYGFKDGEGIYTDMNAIRRDEDYDNTHSIYVDQWDWEKVITENTRNLETLRCTVKAIVYAIDDTLDKMKARFPQLPTRIYRKVHFYTAQELEDMFPELSPKERENKIVREKKTVFIIGIGDKLKSGKPHDGRAPDYDDWSLNGDLLFYHEPLDCALEISSMGIRVSPKSLDEQLTKAGCDDRRNLPFHSELLKGNLPLTMGGGIGQSRLCMPLLSKAHIGEVQVSVWDDKTVEACKKQGVELL